jgi:nucleotide-binding universal stress UspA family protein
MRTITAGSIVVGVTGRGRETPALRFAVDVARREDARIALVHVTRNPLPSVPGALVDRVEATAVAERILADVAQEVEELARGDVAVDTFSRRGVPAEVLVGLSGAARLVVVQHRTSGALERLVVGSTSHGAAAHSACPVVSVPGDWLPDPRAAEVVVGVHEGGMPRQVLEAGFAWAAATGSLLPIVHAWRLDAAYDDIISNRVAAEWHEEQKDRLVAAVAEVRGDWPQVEVEVEVRHQWPADVLVDDSRNASLVVIGRRGVHGWVPEHLGSLARTVLRAARCPVMVVPVVERSGEPGDRALVADELSPQT